jgi:hypothetical protein
LPSKTKWSLTRILTNPLTATCTEQKMSEGTLTANELQEKNIWTRSKKSSITTASTTKINRHRIKYSLLRNWATHSIAHANGSSMVMSALA